MVAALIGDIRMTAPFLALAADLKARAALAPDDVLSLRQNAWPDGKIDPAEAEAIFDLNEALKSAESEWVDFFVAALSNYVVHQTAPAGYVDEAKAGWLMARIDRDGRVDSRAELELLVKILEVSTAVPESLQRYALAQIEAVVLTGAGPTRGGALDPGSVNATEAQLLRRILFAQAGDGPACTSRAEADMLFRIKDVSLGAANAPEWEKLFVQAVGNHLMAYNSYRPLARDEAARREAFVADNQPSIGGFFRRMASAGLSGFSSASASSAAQPDHDALQAEARAINPAEAAWLKERLAAQPGHDPLEVALLSFIADESGQTLD